MGAAEDIAFLTDTALEWMTEMPDRLVEALLEGQKSPFVADLSESDKVAYYTSRFFNPDGTPNEIGRQQELQRLGLPTYVKTLSQMQKLRGLYQPPPLEGG